MSLDVEISSSQIVKQLSLNVTRETVRKFLVSDGTEYTIMKATPLLADTHWKFLVTFPGYRGPDYGWPTVYIYIYIYIYIYRVVLKNAKFEGRCKEYSTLHYKFYI